MKVTPRNPQAAIRIVTRAAGEIPSDILRKALLSFSVNRRLGESCGSWTVTLTPDRKLPWRQDVAKWIDQISPMDYVELSAWVPPRPRVVLMRGLVDSPGSRLSLASQVQHGVTITGRDFGKCCLTSKLYYMEPKLIPQQYEMMRSMAQGFQQLGALSRVKKLFPEKNGQLLGQSLELGSPSLGWDAPDPDIDLQPRAEDNEVPGKPEARLVRHPTEILRVMFGSWVVPQFKLWSKLMNLTVTPTLDDGLAFNEDWELRLAALSPEYSPHSWNPLTDVWDMMRQFQHAPWREMFWDDDATGPVLRYRPTPWLDFQGTEIQPAQDGPNNNFVVHNLEWEDIVESSLQRSDEHVFNLFATWPWILDSAGSAYRMFGAIEGMYDQPPFRSNPWVQGLFDDTETSAYRLFGIRVMERRTPFITLDKNLPYGELKLAIEDIRKLGTEANTRLRKAYDHGEMLEYGTLRLRGDERIRIGQYVDRDKRGELAYVEGLSHTFQQATDGPNGSFSTDLLVTRGRGHIVRSGLGT